MATEACDKNFERVVASSFTEGAVLRSETPKGLQRLSEVFGSQSVVAGTLHNRTDSRGPCPPALLEQPGGDGFRRLSHATNAQGPRMMRSHAVDEALLHSIGVVVPLTSRATRRRERRKRTAATRAQARRSATTRRNERRNEGAPLGALRYTFHVGVSEGDTGCFVVLRRRSGHVGDGRSGFARTKVHVCASRPTTRSATCDEADRHRYEYEEERDTRARPHPRDLPTESGSREASATSASGSSGVR